MPSNFETIKLLLSFECLDPRLSKCYYLLLTLALLSY